MNILKALALAGAAILVCACNNQTPSVMPAVNDANCEQANLEKMTDKAMQRDLASACARRPNYKPSPVRSWNP